MKKLISIISLVTLLALLLIPEPQTVRAQTEEITCESDVVVQADDWLSKIAEKVYGDVLAYQVIADATNAKAAVDDSYATVSNVDVIEPGWKLCIPSAEEAGAALAEEAQALENVPQILRVGQVGDIRSLEPNREAAPNYLFIKQVFDTLLVNERNKGHKGEALESWELASDNMSVTMTLREGMVTHDGSPVDAEMLKFMFEERLNQKDKGVAMYGRVNSIFDSLEIIDPLTVKINFSSPAPNAEDLLAVLPVTDPDMFIKDDNSVALGNEEDKQIGSGPFRMVEYVPGSHMYFERFDDYWEAGAPKLERIEVTFFGDSASMMAALEAGEIHLAYNPPFEAATRFRDDPNYTVWIPQTQGIIAILMVNPEREQLNDPRVRQAINYAINRDAINEAAYGGAGVPTAIPTVPGSLAYTPELEIPTSGDPERARELLAEAGVSEGDIQIGITYGANDDTVRLQAEVIAANLQDVGIDAQLDPREQNIYIQSRVNQDFDTLLSLVGGSNVHPAGLQNSFVYAAQDNQFFDDIEPQQAYLDYAAAFKRGMAADNLTDAAEAWQAAMKALQEGAWVLPLAGQPFLMVSTSGLKGVTWTESDKPIFKYAYLTK